MFFLAVHLAPQGDGHFAGGAAQQAVAISYKMKVQKIEPANMQDLQSLLGILGLSPANNLFSAELAHVCEGAGC